MAMIRYAEPHVPINFTYYYEIWYYMLEITTKKRVLKISHFISGLHFGDKGNGLLLSTANDSLVTSILSVGTFSGALLAFPVGDICIAIQTASTNVPVFAVGRVLAGLGVGLTSCLVPMYQSECSPKWIRGAVVACYQWAITIGLLVAAIIVQLTKDINSLYFLPESPKYLILKGHKQEAMNSLGRLLSLSTNSEPVQKEYDEVNDSLKKENALASFTYLDCFRSGPGKYRLRILTGIALQALQQLSGINFIFYFGTTFFRNSGISNPFLTTIITNAAVMCACEFIVAIVGAVVTGEIYPLAIRAKGMSLSTASNWAFNFAIGYSTPYLVDIGPGKAGLQSKHNGNKRSIVRAGRSALHK
ncbi:hypothetical protein BY996DRAFT_6419800 [Phakopsora pachyrhizi]|nr:hypothetical protein BY996DRAFT_6419800 [Phakopsora pachyrhizi]